MIIGRGGHFRQLIAEGAKERMNLVAIGDNRSRQKEALAHAGYDGRWDTFISAGARLFVVEARIGEGSQVLWSAIVGADARISRHCILNHQCVLEHDAQLGDFVHLAPGARVCGGATVGEGTLVGANAVVLPNDTVPPWSVVAAGTVWGYPRKKRRK